MFSCRQRSGWEGTEFFGDDIFLTHIRSFPSLDPEAKIKREANHTAALRF